MPWNKRKNSSFSKSSSKQSKNIKKQRKGQADDKKDETALRQSASQIKDDRQREILEQLIATIRDDKTFVRQWQRDWHTVNAGLPVNVARLLPLVADWQSKLSAGDRALAETDQISSMLTQTLDPFLGLGGGSHVIIGSSASGDGNSDSHSNSNSTLDGGDLIFCILEYLSDPAGLKTLRRQFELLVQTNSYAGVNRLILHTGSHALFNRSYWVTFKQAQGLQCRIKTNEHGRKIKPPPPQMPRCTEGCPRPVHTSDWWDACRHIRARGNFGAYIKWPVVFNVAQLDPQPVPAVEAIDKTWQRLMPPSVVKRELHRKFAFLLKALEAPESVVAEQRPPITLVYDGVHTAFYQRATKTIHMPAPVTFTSYETFLYTLMKELGHALDHLVPRPGTAATVPASVSSSSSSSSSAMVEDESLPLPLPLPLVDGVHSSAGGGPNDGAVTKTMNELTAELTAGFLACKLGINMQDQLDNSVAYLGSWLSFLERERDKISSSARSNKMHRATQQQQQQAREDTIITAGGRASQLADAFDSLFHLTDLKE